MKCVRDEFVSRGLDGAYKRFPEMIAEMILDCVPDKRGWMLFGGTGTGKTTRAAIASRLAGVKMVRAREFALDAIRIINECHSLERASGFEKGLDSRWRGYDLIIDDLGTEFNEMMVYGTKINPMQTILEERLDNWPNIRTYITTNLTPTDIERRYGEKVASRFAEAIRPVSLEGVDRRRQ